MGVLQSSISPEAATAVGALLAGTVTAYTVFKHVADVDNDAKSASSSSVLSSSSTTVPNSGKKNRGKKRKETRGTGAGAGADGDADLDELVARAKAEAAAVELAKAKVTATRNLVPGAFDADAASSEAEGKEKKESVKARKKGKKAAGGGGGATATTPGVGAGSAVRDGDNKENQEAAPTRLQSSAPTQAPASAEPTAPSSKKSKKRKGGAKPQTQALSPGTNPPSSTSSPPSASLRSSQALGMSMSQSLTMSDAPEDASWTRVSTRKKGVERVGSRQALQRLQTDAIQTEPELLTSDTNLTTSGVTDLELGTEGTEEEEEEDKEGSVQELEPEKRRTFAERMLPRPRKIGVEDMEDEPLQPTLARVMRVKPALGEKPAEGFSWGDYEEYAHGDDGTSADGDADDAWEEVKSKKKSKSDRSTSGMTSSVDSLPLQHHSSQQQQSAPSKKQRQNAERREAARLEKEAAERVRLERLARHNRELERERIAAQFAGSGSGGGGKKNLSGGMTASVQSGKLVWESS